MILISHRGNINGKIPEYENNPDYVDSAINLGYDVEIDLWWVDGRTYLGHDEPQYEVSDEWLRDRMDKLWVHCKNVELLNWIRSTTLHYFWHEEDTLTLTSKNHMWVYQVNNLLLEVLPLCLKYIMMIFQNVRVFVQIL